ncbi:MAG: DUF3786 domain-containing protein [Proteobacteria bacterium]|nr:DUF3786 domain-containing protein [Pseudomonadota bacterium]
MALSVVDLYRDVLPKTNCRDCGFSTCMAFASMVVSEKYPLANCPHLDKETLNRCTVELEAQYAEGKWLKKDMAQDALKWAKEKAASTDIKDLPERIGGMLVEKNGDMHLELRYFNDAVLISKDGMVKKNGEALTRWEKVFLYNHVAQGGRRLPAGNWKGLVEFPNTVSKMKSMIAHVETPLIEKFRGHTRALLEKALAIGGQDIGDNIDSADVAVLFQPLPKVPVRLMFWDKATEEGIEAEVKLSFDETITEHLDIESIMFLSERIRQLLCEP